MKCMHCIKKASVFDHYGRYLCPFHDHELNKDKFVEAMALIGSISIAVALIIIVVLSQKGA